MVPPPQHVRHKRAERALLRPDHLPRLAHHHRIQKRHQETSEGHPVHLAPQLPKWARVFREVLQEERAREGSREAPQERVDGRVMGVRGHEERCVQDLKLCPGVERSSAGQLNPWGRAGGEWG